MLRHISGVDNPFIGKQHDALTLLWGNVLNELKEKMNLMIQLLEWLEDFQYKASIFETFMNGIEKSISASYSITSPEKQREKIKQVMLRKSYFKTPLSTQLIYVIPLVSPMLSLL